MGYTKPVKFSVVNPYDPKTDVYTVEQFVEYCKDGSFIDYDGHGHPVKDGKANCSVMVLPSQVHKIPKDATHVVWYNR